MKKYEKPIAMQNIIQIQLKLLGIFFPSSSREKKPSTNKEKY